MTYILNQNEELLLRLIAKSAATSTLKKAVFSKPASPEIKKSVLSLKEISGKTLLQAEDFYSDNKAKHRNIALEGSSAAIGEMIISYSQINLITTAGECSLMRSKSGKVTLIDGNKLEKALFSDGEGVQAFKKITPSANNKKKQYILNGDEPFLKLLEVSDKNGRVYDKKQAKFRQINRFLELVRDVEDKLPEGKDCNM